MILATSTIKLGCQIDNYNSKISIGKIEVLVMTHDKVYLSNFTLTRLTQQLQPRIKVLCVQSLGSFLCLVSSILDLKIVLFAEPTFPLKIVLIFAGKDALRINKGILTFVQNLVLRSILSLFQNLNPGPVSTSQISNKIPNQEQFRDQKC